MPRKVIYVKPRVFSEDNEFSYHSALYMLGDHQLPSGAPLPNLFKQGRFRLNKAPLDQLNWYAPEQMYRFCPAQIAVDTFEDPAFGPLIVTPNKKEWVRDPIHRDAEDFRAKWVRFCNGNPDRLYVRNNFAREELVLINGDWPEAVLPEELAGPEPKQVIMSFMRAPLNPSPYVDN